MTHDNLHDKIGQAIADHLTSLAEDNVVTLDPFDARNIDAIVEEVMPVVKAELEQLLAAQEQAAIIGMRMCDEHDVLRKEQRLLRRALQRIASGCDGNTATHLASRALAGQCLDCGSSGFEHSVTGRGCTFCDGTQGGNPPSPTGRVGVSEPNLQRFPSSDPKVKEIADQLRRYLMKDRMVTEDMQRAVAARNLVNEFARAVAFGTDEQCIAAGDRVVAALVAAWSTIDRAQLVDIVDKHLDGTYHCLRVWEAWRHGTMSEDDFLPVVDSETPHDLVDAIMKLIGEPT